MEENNKKALIALASEVANKNFSQKEVLTIAQAMLKHNPNSIEDLQKSLKKFLNCKSGFIVFHSFDTGLQAISFADCSPDDILKAFVNILGNSIKQMIEEDENRN